MKKDYTVKIQVKARFFSGNVSYYGIMATSAAAAKRRGLQIYKRDETRRIVIKTGLTNYGNSAPAIKGKAK